MTDTFTNTRGIPDNAVLPSWLLTPGAEIPLPPVPAPVSVQAPVQVSPAPLAPASVRRITRSGDR